MLQVIQKGKHFYSMGDSDQHALGNFRPAADRGSGERNILERDQYNLPCLCVSFTFNIHNAHPHLEL